MGRPNPAISEVSISARRKLRASATWTTTSASRLERSLLVMRSSSLSSPWSELTPGLSTMSQTSAPTSARPDVTPTVVPG